MRRLLSFLCVTLAVPIVFSLTVYPDEISFYELNYFPYRDSHPPIDFNWIVDRYDFDRVEEYIDENIKAYYGAYYKHWERYVTSKQREVAGKFGLSNIALRPNFRSYEDTELVLSKRVWDDRLVLRYLAPLGDVWDFRLSIALRPNQFAKLVAEGDVNGGGSIAIVVNKPFGIEEKKHESYRAKQLLTKVRQFVR